MLLRRVTSVAGVASWRLDSLAGARRDFAARSGARAARRRRAAAAAQHDLSELGLAKGRALAGSVPSAGALLVLSPVGVLVPTALGLSFLIHGGP